MKIKYCLILPVFIIFLVGCTLQQPEVIEPNQPAQNSNIQASNSVEATLPFEEVIEPVEPILEVPEPDIESTEDISIIVDKPSIFIHNVAFASQTPYGVWDELHGETCEEASMIMAVNFFQTKPLSNHIMEQGLLSLVKWQDVRGYKVDLDADEVVEILDTYFNQSAHLLFDVSVDSIIAELDQGNLIIVPAAGRNLGNPYFTAPGPVYHMLVIKGYDRNTGEFITNDPGTKRGESYRYKYSRLLSAIAEWDHSLAADGMTQEEIEQGRRVLIVVTP